MDVKPVSYTHLDVYKRQTWEWAEDIDIKRAEAARTRAEDKLHRTGLTDQDYKMAKAKLQRALVRLSVKQ